MSRRIFVSIAAALVLAPLTAFAADSAPSSYTRCACSQISANSTASSATTAKSATASNAPANSYQGLTQAELERIWASAP